MSTTPHPSGFQEDDNIDLKRYLSLFISNWYWFAIALFLSVSIAYGINRYSEEIYTVSSTLLIKDDQMGGGIYGIETFLPGGDLFRNRQNIKNEIGILQSFTLHKRVIDSLPEFHIIYIGVGRRNIAEARMYRNSPFVLIPNDTILQPQTQIFLKIISEHNCRIELNDGIRFDTTLNFGDRFKSRGFDFRVELRDTNEFRYDPSASNKYRVWFAPAAVLANQYRHKLGINTIDEDASVLSLSLTGPETEQEADYLNMLMEVYLQQGLDLKKQTAVSTIKFIEDQLEVINESLIQAEDDLMRFRDDNRLIDISREGASIMAKLEKFESERTQIRLQLQYYEYLNDYLSVKGTSHDLISPSAMGVTDPQLVRLVQEVAVLQQQKRQMLMNLQFDTEPLALLEQSLQQARSALAEIVLGGMGTIKSSLDDVNGRIETVEKGIGSLAAVEREFIGIQRKFEINNTVYTYLLEKRAEAGIAKASTVSDNRIIDRAQPFNSSQIRPKRRNNYLIALFLGMFIPTGLILIIDYLNYKIMDRKDIEKGTTVPILGYISHNPGKTELPVFEKPGSTLAESFRSVRTNLRFFTKEINCPVITVSSTISAEGKTFISVNLATIIASLGKKVLLVGLDLRKPRLHEILRLENSAGVSTYLSGENAPEDIILGTIIENLFYAPAGPVPPNPAELIESEKMKHFLDNARNRFDYIIIDTPPVAIVTDALLLAPLVDLYLLVVRQRHTSRNTLNLIDELHKSGTFKSMALVVNDISLTGYYGYGLRYGYNLGCGYNYYIQQNYGGYGYDKSAKGYYTED